MYVEIASIQELEQRLSVEVNILEFGVCLVVHVWISESASVNNYPFEMMRPFCSWALEWFTPWIRIISPHLSVECSAIVAGLIC